MIETIKGFIAKEDFANLYETMHNEDLTPEIREELSRVTLELATEKAHDKMLEKSLFDFDLESEQFVLRLLYEQALARFELGEYYEAKETLSMLSVASNSKLFEKSLKKHLLALDEKVDFETFIQTWVSRQTPKHFFISDFSKEVEKKFVKEEKNISMATQRYAKLFR